MSVFTKNPLLFWLFSGLILLLPIIFIPALSVPLLLVKYGFLVVVVVAAMVIWVIQRLRDGVFLLPVNMLNLAGLFVLLTLFISALFSGSIWNSLFGQLPQTDTFIFCLMVFVLMFMVPIVFNSAKQILTLYKIFFITLALLAIFQGSRVFLGAGWLSFGYFPNITDNVLSKWNDLGIFFGLGAVISLVAVELLTLSKSLKILSYIALGVCMLLLAIINFVTIWYVLAALALFFFIYSIVIARAGPAKKTVLVTLPVTSLIIFLISVAFLLGGARFSNLISTNLNISQVEVVPTWQATAGIAQNVILHGSPIQIIFGVGPNRFVNEWLLYKPAGVNQSVFWNTDFNFGVGLIPSALITTGLIGLLAWLAFLGILIYMGFRAILSRLNDPIHRFLVISSFLSALYLWLFSLIYVPSLVIIVLTFIFTGLFIASLQIAGILKISRFEYFKNSKIGFVSVLCLILILIGSLGLAYTTVTKFVAAEYYNRGLTAANSHNLDLGEQQIKSAIGFNNNAVYVRTLAQLYLIRLSNLLGTETPTTASTSADLLRNQFATFSNSAVLAAQYALSLDQTDYQNWLMQGDAWSALATFEVNGAYDNASTSYQKALSLNPQNPYIYLELAKLEAGQNNASSSKDNLIKALNLKNNYPDAYFQLGILQYNNRDYQGALDAFQQVAVLDPSNTQIAAIISNLKSGNLPAKAMATSTKAKTK